LDVKHAPACSHDQHIISLQGKQYRWCDVCLCRLMSQIADVNIQSSVGMFTFCDILGLNPFCYKSFTRLFVLCLKIPRYGVYTFMTMWIRFAIIHFWFKWYKKISNWLILSTKVVHNLYLCIWYTGECQYIELTCNL